VQYNYDGMGRRRNSLVNSTDLTWYRWNGFAQYADYAAGNDPNTVWDIGAVERTYIPGLAEVLPSGSTSMATYQYHTLDHLGSPRGIWDASGNLLGARSFSPYGMPRVLAGLPLGTGFTGHHWDSSIQQYYALYRNYSPGTARWNMRDPLGYVDGLNVYAYVQGDPLGFRDLFGLSHLVFCSNWELLFILNDKDDAVKVLPAANNPDRSKGVKPWPPGRFPFHEITHHADDNNGPDSRYGPLGNFKFKKVPGRSDMGVHGGRAPGKKRNGDKTYGYKHPTYGCIRTTNDGMSWIAWTNYWDPIEDLTVTDCNINMPSTHME
jgi:RHS repeat-associated protein